MLSRIIVGLVGASLGFLITWQAEWFYQNFGQSAFAEKWLRLFGGTRLFVKLLGVLIIILSFMYMTGLLGPTVIAIFGSMFSGFGGVEL